MVEHLWDSMTLILRAKTTLALTCVLALAACSTREVVVEGKFPTPVVDPVPISVGVLFTKDFREHVLFDDATGRGEASWRVSTGVAQVEFWSTLLPGFFQNVVFIESYEDLNSYDVDAVLIPELTDVQYSLPLYTNVKIYEIWMRYQLSLVDPEQLKDDENQIIATKSAKPFVQWRLTAYGKTPTAFLRSETDAVNEAAIMALRDAGANFIESFDQIPNVSAWIQSLQETQ